MFNKMTYSKKKRLLYIGAILLFLLSYPLAIKKTVSLKKTCNRYRADISLLSNAPELIGKYQQRLNEIEQYIGGENILHRNLQEDILEKSSSFCEENGLVIFQFPEPHLCFQDDYQIETCKLVIKGDFINSLRLLYEHEYVYKLGNVISVDFTRQLDKKTKKEELLTTLFIQNIKKIKQ